MPVIFSLYFPAGCLIRPCKYPQINFLTVKTSWESGPRGHLKGRSLWLFHLLFNQFVIFWDEPGSCWPWTFLWKNRKHSPLLTFLFAECTGESLPSNSLWPLRLRGQVTPGDARLFEKRLWDQVNFIGQGPKFWSLSILTCLQLWLSTQKAHYTRAGEQIILEHWTVA